MGDAGVASTPDIYSAHWNNAKFAFIEGDFGFSTTYTPWLRNLGVGDMNLLYLGGYKRINKMSTVAASLTYFSLGEIQTTDFDGNSTGIMNPNEFAVDASYALKINEELSLGASARFIRSPTARSSMPATARMSPPSPPRASPRTSASTGRSP